MGKELRLFGLANELAVRHRAVSDDLADRTTRAYPCTVPPGTSSAVFAVGYDLAVLVVAGQAVNGAAALGSVVLVISQRPTAIARPLRGPPHPD
ncbi:hypothetical protein ACFV27_38655 [Streptomyces antimycoticus]|uniref:hypothetical protein n=1 Tax=Streptomyces antimycoticus TaxID=68175 RepID=UPI0036A2257D